MLTIELCCLPGRALTLLHQSGKFRTRDGCHSRKRCCTSFFAFDQRASDGWEEKNNQTENLHLLQKIVISTYSSIPLAPKKCKKPITLANFAPNMIFLPSNVSSLSISRCHSSLVSCGYGHWTTSFNEIPISI